VVYQAQHGETARDAALKVGRRDAGPKERLERSLRYEAELLREVNHPHVVQLFEEGTLDDGMPYLAMELARGHDLAERLEQCGTLSIPMVVEIGRQLLSALEGLAEAGIVHRDLKPENVMLEEIDDGFRVKLIDLGIAVSTRAPWTARLEGETGTFAGTPEYVSPEQAQGLPVDRRSDLYSLGAVLYECLTGSPPCGGATPYETLVQVITADPAPLRVIRADCPPSLERVVMQALAKAPGARFQSAGSMSRALRACARGDRMPEGLEVWRGAPRVASNATAPFALHRRRGGELGVVTDAAIAEALATRDAPAEERFASSWSRRASAALHPPSDLPGPAEPRHFERRLPPSLPMAPPRERAAYYAEREIDARWLFAIAIGVLLLTLLGAIVGSGELRLGARGGSSPTAAEGHMAESRAWRRNGPSPTDTSTAPTRSRGSSVNRAT
jgi:hypothetical protein